MERLSEKTRCRNRTGPFIASWLSSRKQQEGGKAGRFLRWTKSQLRGERVGFPLAFQGNISCSVSRSATSSQSSRRGYQAGSREVRPMVRESGKAGRFGVDKPPTSSRSAWLPLERPTAVAQLGPATPRRLLQGRLQMGSQDRAIARSCAAAAGRSGSRTRAQRGAGVGPGAASSGD